MNVTLLNSTAASDTYGTALWEDLLIGGIFFVASLLVGVTTVPCMAVMVREPEMWKNSCIKVGHLRI